jgi:hypothetical protein
VFTQNCGRGISKKNSAENSPSPVTATGGSYEQVGVIYLGACCFFVYYSFYELEEVVQYLRSWQELRGQLQMGHFLSFLLRKGGK